MKDCTSHVVGIDIGGANLKYASSRRDASPTSQTHSTSFQLWRRPDELSSALIHDLRRFERVNALAITMTGELADCFVDRAVGVRHIVQQVANVAETLGVSLLAFYRVDGNFCRAQHAMDEPDLVAAANWHASANWASKNISPEGLLIDVGSTTTDIVPVSGGCVATDAKTDLDRLVEGSLVYIGCERTPVCALVDKLTFRGTDVPVMNEFFATIHDARTVLRLAAECPDNVDTADGKPRTVAMSANRLARMIGMDNRTVSIQEANDMARQVVLSARDRINTSVTKIWNEKTPIIMSGHGSDMVELPPDCKVTKLTDIIGPNTSRCLPAFAVAMLLKESHQE